VDSRLAIAQDSKGGVTVAVHVQPKAARTECVGIHGDAVKIRVAAPPVDGAANEELIRFLADCCGIPTGAVCIQGGVHGRRKRVSLSGVTAEWVAARLLPPMRKGAGKS
jgi:uncharacterized protein (TIGR00251 family)